METEQVLLFASSPIDNLSEQKYRIAKTIFKEDQNIATVLAKN